MLNDFLINIEFLYSPEKAGQPTGKSMGSWSEKDDVLMPISARLEFLFCKTAVIMPAWRSITSSEWYRRCKLLRQLWSLVLECRREVCEASLLWNHSFRQFKRVSISLQLADGSHGSSSGNQGVGDGEAMAPCFQRRVELQSLERVISLRLGWICGKIWMPTHPK